MTADMNGTRGLLGNQPLLAAALTAVLGSGVAQAQDQALTREALARCAGQVQTLREEAPRLTQLNASYAEKRRVINARTAALQAERKTIDPDDLAKGLDYRQRMQQHSSETLAFNADIEQLKREVVAIDALKTDYDRNCAQRPYRRSDLETLPESARNAMRAGLSGIQVPYLDPAAYSSEILPP